MKNSKTLSRNLSAAALAGMIVGSAAGMSGCNQTSSDPGMQSTHMVTATHACKGQNDCKGQGGCKTSDQGCNGKNSCKGKGGCKVAAQ